MITPENYLSQIAKVDLSTLPMPLQKGHEFLMKATQDATDWKAYHDSTAIRKTIQLYLERLADHLKSATKPVRKPSPLPAPPSESKPPKSPQASKKEGPKGLEPTLVERVPEELRFLRRFVNLDGKTKTKEEILRLVNGLQRAIVEKRIRKSSPYAEQIRFMQEKLIGVYNSMGAKINIELKADTAEALRNLAGGEKVMASIGFIKRYIAMNGKAGMKEKAKQLLEQINKAMLKGTLSDSDAYISEIHELKKNLKAFISDKSIKVLEIGPAALNGLEGALGCACNGRAGIMNSVELAGLEFDTLGFTGKWLELIGDPSSGFTAMVFGKPKMGKSYLCIDFAGYLARNHGRVLYVAREEGLDVTLQKKLNDKAVAHPNLDVASFLPVSLHGYDFVFLDSVNRLGLTPEALNRLRAANPGKSFVFIFQSNKDGSFRGANAYQHDVDVVIEIPEKGRAVQFGRFNQGGEISIF